MTSSNASLSPAALSFRISQYSSVCTAACRNSSKLLTCFRSSPSVSPDKAISVVEHSSRVVFAENSGGGGGPLLRRSVFEPVDPTDVEDVFFCFNLPNGPRSPPSEDGRRDSASIDGSTSFFCLLAGNISSRSTGTPSDTRNNRRILDRTQSGGCSGGGATSCAHND